MDGEAILFSFQGKTYAGIVVGEVFHESEWSEKALWIQHTDAVYGSKPPYLYALSALDYWG